MRSRRLRAAGTSRPVEAGVLAVVLIAGGCTRTREPKALDLPRQATAVIVRIGPLVSEHPLYPEVHRLTALIEERPRSSLAATAEFLSGPFGGLSMEVPEPAAPLAVPVTAWEAEAEAELSAELDEARALVRDWPTADFSAAEERLAADAEQALQDARNEAGLAIVRAERLAVEARKGELVELRRRAASADSKEAAEALDRQAAVWREVEAEVEEARRRAEAERRTKESEVGQRIRDATARMRRGAEEGATAHLGALAESGERARDLQRGAVGAARRRVDPPAGPPDTRAAPRDDLAKLVRAIERAQQAAWQRRRARLVDVRGQLLNAIAASTRNAVRGLAAGDGVEAIVDGTAPPGVPDATESFRVPLRRYWTGQGMANGEQTAGTLR